MCCHWYTTFRLKFIHDATECTYQKVWSVCRFASDLEKRSSRDWSFLRLTDLFFFNTQANISKQFQKIPIYFFVPWLICAFPFAPHSKHWKSTLDYNFTRPMRRLLPTKSGFCRTKTRILKDQLLGNSSKGRKYPHHLFGKQSQKPLHPWIFATRRRT